MNDYIRYVGREIGMLAKIWKKCNKEPVDKLDRREEFMKHTGNLLGYCSAMFNFIREDEFSVLERIIFK